MIADTPVTATLTCMGEREVVPGAAAGGPISHTIFRLARIHRLIAGRLLREVGLHASQELLLMRLWDGGPQRQTDLGAELGTDSAATTRIVQRLEESGYVRRVPDPADRRATLVENTAQGLALREHVERIWEHLEELTVGEMTPEQQQTALDCLLRLECNLHTGVTRE
ncbi:MarR family transcriptional regulator [Actinoplanes friuliensis DSM 7358]|uniref:MarR family transcriptional regulator n=2 Tax=Actinoplanes friuliensis TaxID=196914 RepID=U5W6P3_9ACTN|nr:MarR family transcriptional regulator [Actinoplanes friuliensis DSM 7358]